MHCLNQNKIQFPNQEIKPRPVLIISKFSKNPNQDIFVCLPITSALYNDPYSLKINADDTQEGFFPKPSQVLCQYYFTELKDSANRKLAKVTPQFFQKIKEKVRNDILNV